MSIINYNQCNPKWKNSSYTAGGDKRTICSDGCGPACIADIVATYIDPEVTPVEVCNLSMKKGYKAPYQGTYYAGIAKLLDVYGIKAYQLNFSNIYSIPSSPYHQQALDAVKNGDIVIACMGKGLWTTSGHYVLWYGYENGRVLVNDPFTQKPATQNADYNRFKKEVKYYFIVNVPKKGDDYVVEQKSIYVNGKPCTINAIEHEGKNYVELASLNSTGQFDNNFEGNIPNINFKTSEELVNVCGEDITMQCVKLNDRLYPRLSDFNKSKTIKVSYKNNTPHIEC